MVMGDSSCSNGCGFKSRRHILDGHFFTLICCKNCIVCLFEKTKNKQKEAGVGPFTKKIMNECLLPKFYCSKMVLKWHFRLPTFIIKYRGFKTHLVQYNYNFTFNIYVM